jgi:hypothetical protein
MNKVSLEFIRTPLRSFTFESPAIKKYVEDNCEGKVLNLFAGKVKLSIDEFRVDLDKTYKPDFIGDAYEYIKNCKAKFDMVLLDPPYSYRKSMEYYNGNYTSKFKLIADEIKKLGIKKVISFGYHTTFMGKIRGYELKKICILGHSGAQHATLVITEITED